MNLIIDKAKVEDAKELLEYLKLITTESDNLIITEEQVEELSMIDEEMIIDSYLNSKTGIILIGKIDEEIVGMGSLEGNDLKSRISHRVKLGITVKKKYWNQGIGREIIDAMLQYASNNKTIEIVELEVHSKNYGAISLYERFGFEEIGYYPDYFKYKDGYGDAILMNLYL